MIPFVTANLSDIALVQHAPWGGDGGTEETTYTLYCLDFWLHSPSGMPLDLDLILFNVGMHDGPMMNNTFPGQNAPPTNVGFQTRIPGAYKNIQKYRLRLAHCTKSCSTLLN